MEDYTSIIDGVTDRCKDILKDNLIGVYVHGSIAMQCFRWSKSDIDLLIVVKEEPDIKTKHKFMEVIIEYNKLAPPKGIELSMVLEEACREFVYPTPFVLHFSNMHLDWFSKDPMGYCSNMRGEDKDLAAHFTITKKYGITWWGINIDELFGEVAKEYYLDSIQIDMKDSMENIEVNPMYTILTLCRVAAFVKDGLILSKEQGGRWGSERLPEEYSCMAKDALQCYMSDRIPVFDMEECKRFGSYLMEMMEE
jgi:predicted nucleotidyltransferase